MATDQYEHLRNQIPTTQGQTYDAQVQEAKSVQQRQPETMPAVVDHGSSPLDMPVVAFSGALKRRGDNRKALIQWIRDSLVPGVDFGPIHVAKNCNNKYNCNNPMHYSKDSLRKPGAEKICGMLGVLVTFPALAKYEESALNGVAIESIILRCLLLSPDGTKVVAEGTGARNLAQDFGDLNKALKMCEKSAQIDATLRMAGLSEIFTQDLEDTVDQPAADWQPPAQPQPSMTHSTASYPDPRGPEMQGQPTATNPVVQESLPMGPGSQKEPSPPDSTYATMPQRDYIQETALSVGVTSAELYTKFKITSLAQLPKARVSEALQWLRSYNDLDDSAEIPNIGKDDNAPV